MFFHKLLVRIKLKHNISSTKTMKTSFYMAEKITKSKKVYLSIP